MKKFIVSALALTCLLSSCEESFFAVQKLSIEPEGISISAASQVVTLNIKSENQWEASLNDSTWSKILIKDVELGAVVLSISCNDSMEPRKDTLTVSQDGKKYLASIEQGGMSEFISSNSFEFVSTESNVLYIKPWADWHIDTAGAPWITLSQAEGESGEFFINIAPAENHLDIADRSGSLSLQIGKDVFTVHVLQKKTDVIRSSTKKLELDYSEQSFSVDLEFNVDYSISFDADWISHTGTRALNQRKEVFLAKSNYTDSDRSTNIVFSSEDGSLSHTLSVSQVSRAKNVLGKNYGIYKEDGSTILEYRKRVHQLSRLSSRGNMSFRMINAEQNSYISISNLPREIKYLDKFTISVDGDAASSLKKTYTVECGAVQDHKAYLFSEEGIVFIIKF